MGSRIMGAPRTLTTGCRVRRPSIEVASAPRLAHRRQRAACDLARVILRHAGACGFGGCAAVVVRALARQEPDAVELGMARSNRGTRRAVSAAFLLAGQRLPTV